MASAADHGNDVERRRHHICGYREMRERRVQRPDVLAGLRSGIGYMHRYLARSAVGCRHCAVAAVKERMSSKIAEDKQRRAETDVVSARRRWWAGDQGLSSSACSLLKAPCQAARSGCRPRLLATLVYWLADLVAASCPKSPCTLVLS